MSLITKCLGISLKKIIFVQDNYKSEFMEFKKNNR